MLHSLMQTGQLDWSVLEKYGTVIFMIYIIVKEIIPILQAWLIPERKQTLQAKADELAYRRRREEEEWKRKCEQEDRLNENLEKLSENLLKQSDVLVQIQTSIVLLNERMQTVENDVSTNRNGITKLVDRNEKIDKQTREKTVQRPNSKQGG